jgi:septal ring factor EnvC (AmiA/AmiB activator)
MMVTEKEQEKTEDAEEAENRLEDLQQENEYLNRELKSKDATIIRLEQELTGKDNEIAALKQALGESRQTLDELGKALPEAVAAYKEMVVQANPGVLAELITGETIEEVDESMKNAQALVERVRQEMEAEASRTKVPAGAPQRTPLDLSGLSPREKIQYAIRGLTS